MTLRCKCGGPVRVQGGTDPAESDDGFFEHYECQACGRTGGLEYDPLTGTALSGCLTTGNAEVYLGP